jgi:hypothetical protein
MISSFACALAWSSPEDQNYTRIARLSYVEGNVSFQHGSDVDWSAASINMPLEPGDRLYTGANGRAEIEFDDGSVFRLAENTDAEFLSLKQDLVQIRMLLGLSTLTVSGDADFEIDTPAAAFNAVRNGIYRFDVVENGDTDAIVRKGELEAANDEFSQKIQAGGLMHISPRDSRNPQVSQYDRRDSWDEWNDRRNADIKVYGNVQYLPDNVYMGASEMYRYGRWVNVESYGNAWVPADVDEYWAPYSVGRWCYRPFYGWTWISYEPWGWLPYHYGRWYRSSMYGWCWLPGPSFSFNFWSPALVTFYNGPGWISWCPLGPGDYYDVRHYHYNHGIYSHQLGELRGLHTRRPDDPFNRQAYGAFRTVRLEDFRNGSFDNRNRNSRWERVEKPWSQGTLVRDRLPVQPTSTSFSAVPNRSVVRPRTESDLPAVVRNTPGAELGNRERFKTITNPQIPAPSPRILRNRGESVNQPGNRSGSNTRVIQAPSNPPQQPPAEQRDGRNNSSRGGNRGDNSNRSREVTTPNPRPQNTAPQNQQNQQESPRQRDEQREQRSTPPPDSRPRSEFREQSNYSEARPGVGRWSESNRGSNPGMGTIQAIRPQSGNVARWGSENPGAVRSQESAPAYSAPPSENRGRWGGSSNPGVGRSQESIAPRQPARSFERSGGDRPAAPIRGDSNSNANRSSDGNSNNNRSRR